MRIHDISVPISTTTPIFPGDPLVEISAWAALARGDAANVSLLRFGAHTATHVDAPAHFIAAGRRVTELPLEALIGPAQVVMVPDAIREIDAEFLRTVVHSDCKRLLFKTQNSQFWNDTSAGFRQDFTALAPDGARWLVELGLRLVGIDYLSIEKYNSPDHPTHVALLGADIIVLEGLDLRQIEPGDYELICLPLKLDGGTGDGAPARAVLRTLT